MALNYVSTSAVTDFLVSSIFKQCRVFSNSNLFSKYSFTWTNRLSLVVPNQSWALNEL